MKKYFRVLLVLCCMLLMFSIQKEECEASTAEEQAERLREIYTELYPAYEVTGELSYFTVNGNACTHAYDNANGCTNCGLKSILDDLNAKNPDKFGNAYNLYNSSPKNAWTCCAFQRFVQLYVFDTREWLEDEYTTIFSMKKASYDNFSKLCPGDEINYKNSAGTTTHYAIFLECDENTVTILDCNYSHATYGVAVVTVRTVTYNSLSSRYFTAYRANNSKLTSENFGSDSISVDPTYITVPIGESFNFNLGGALETNVDNDSLIWTSSDTSVVTVSNGVVTGKKAGEATITVTTESGVKDTVIINVVSVSYNAAEKWTVSSTQIGGRVSNNSNAERACRYSNGYYLIKKGAELTILAKKTDDSGNTWGFGAGYSEYLGQNIWGWFDLLDDKLGSETFNYSYYPGKPTVTVSKTGEGVVTISWTSASSATSYDVYKIDTLIKSRVTSTSITYEMSFGECADFKVVAINEEFPYSNLFSCITASSTVSYTMPECVHPTTSREIRNAKNATCSSTGYTGDTYCTLCEKKISSGSIVKKTDHSYSSIWKKDSTSHWYECVGCGATKDVSSHAYDNICDTDCNTCGFVRNVSHQYSATWVTDGVNHWHICIKCNIKKDFAEHTPGNAATETTSQKCTICGYVITPMIGHIHEFAEDYEYDDTMHWHLCSCGQKDGIELHTWDGGVVNSEPTENTEGEKTYTCTMCGSTYVELIEKLEDSEEHGSEFESETSDKLSSDIETDNDEIGRGEEDDSVNHEKTIDLGPILTVTVVGITAIFLVSIYIMRFKKK